MIDLIIETAYNARHGYWRTNGGRRIDAVLCILFADLAAFPKAWETLRYEYKGMSPLSLAEIADAIDAAYYAGF